MFFSIVTQETVFSRQLWYRTVGVTTDGVVGLLGAGSVVNVSEQSELSVC